MKFTKKEQRNIKHYFNMINKLLQVNKIYEHKNPIPKGIKKNLILYGIFTGKIKETIYKKIDFKKEENNLNADELIKELFGINFFNWLTKENNDFIYGNENTCNINNSNNNISNN